MITQESVDRVLPVVADSWPQLRGCDVHRLVGSIHCESRESVLAFGEIITANRPDLKRQVDAAVDDVIEDQFE